MLFLNFCVFGRCLETSKGIAKNEAKVSFINNPSNFLVHLLVKNHVK
jgi:hypothetical protein